MVSHFSLHNVCLYLKKIAKYYKHVFTFFSLQLKPRLDTTLPTVSPDSEQEMDQDNQEEPEKTCDQSSAP